MRFFRGTWENLRYLLVALALITLLIMSGCGVSKEEVTQLRTEISAVKSKLEQLEKKIESSSSEKVEELEKKLLALEDKLGKLEAKISSEKSTEKVKKEEVPSEEETMEEPSIEEEVELEDIGTLPKKYREAIEDLIDRGVIDLKGSKFRPNEPLTNGELAKWIVRAKGLTLKRPDSPSFKDVSKDSPLYPYVETLKALGIMGGYPDGTFRPDDKVTREKLIVILLKAAGLETEVNKLSDKDVEKIFNTDASNVNWGEPIFQDVKEVSPWARKYIAYALSNKHDYYCDIFNIKKVFWSNISKRPKLEPKKPVTRAEGAYAVKLILER